MTDDSEQERWTDEGPMARAVCKNADCRIETGLPLDDGSELTPAPLPRLRRTVADQVFLPPPGR